MMKRKPIPPFGETERWIVQQTLKERYGKEIAVEIGQGDIRLNPEDQELVVVPVIYWTEQGAKFVIFKTGTDRYRCQFYYRGYQQFATGKDEFDNVGDCVVTLLQVQAEHEQELAKRPTPRFQPPVEQPSAKKPGDGTDEDWIYQPVIWE